MRKKMLAIAIISMFLLTGFSVVSAAKIVKPEAKTLDELPDLKISLSSPKKGVIIATVENLADVEGVKEDPCSDPFICYLMIDRVYNIDGQEFVLWYDNMVIEMYSWVNAGHGIPANFYKEYEFDRFPTYLGIGPSFKLRITAYTDCYHGGEFSYIVESDESNNHAEIEIAPAGLKSRTKIIQSPLSMMLQRLLDKLPNAFPVLSQIFGL